MAIEKKHEQEHENEERWLLTYADLITLLMVFFVVMYAMSKSDVAKFQQMAETMAAAFSNPMGSKTGFQARLPKVQAARADLAQSSKGTDPRKRSGGAVHHSAAIEKLKQKFEEMIKRAQTTGTSVSVAMNKDETALVVRLSDSLLFEPGSADLSPGARPLMDKVAELLKTTESQIRVEGHTDNIPINNVRYQSNWELSTSRAVTVLRYLLDAHHLAPDHLSAGGYGEFRPIQPNDSPEHRSANRRVEFVILDENVEKDKPATAGAASTEPAESSAPVTSPAPAEPSAPTTTSAPDLPSPPQTDIGVPAPGGV